MDSRDRLLLPGLGQLGSTGASRPGEKIELFRLSARSKQDSVLAEYRIKSIAPQLCHEDFVCAGSVQRVTIPIRGKCANPRWYVALLSIWKRSSTEVTIGTGDRND